MMYCAKCYLDGAIELKLPPCPTSHFKEKVGNMPSFKDRLKAFLDADSEEEEAAEKAALKAEIETLKAAPPKASVEVGLEDTAAEAAAKVALKAEIEALKAAAPADDAETIALRAELEALKGEAGTGTEPPPAAKSTATKPVRTGASSKKVDVSSMTMEERAKYGTDIMAPADKAGKSLI